MPYERTIENIRSGQMTRGELKTVRENALAKKLAGDPHADAVLQAVDQAVAKDAGIIFMGFCPNADLANRRDIEWKANSVCTFDYYTDKVQMNTFHNICAGDLLVLKKSETFGKTMRLFGHGRVIATKDDAQGHRYLKMDWAAQDDVIEVPLMACQSTVNLRSMERVEAEMPEEFFTWLS
jgi:hypothetical protein